MRVFSNRKKIHGVSFYHKSAQRRRKEKSALSNYFDLELLFIQIRKEMPLPLSSHDIKHFLCDHGRNEIHTHVSECTDFISKWTGIVKIMDRCFFASDVGFKDAYSNLLNGENEFALKDNELEVFLSAKKLLALWKHRLYMFEMIVEAQGSLRFLKRY